MFPRELNTMSIKLDLTGLIVNAHFADLLALKVEEELFFSHWYLTNVELDFEATLVASLECVA